MSGGAVLIGETKNYKVYIRYSMPDERKHIRTIEFKDKRTNRDHHLSNDMPPDVANQDMLNEFEQQQAEIERTGELGSLAKIVDKEKLTLAEIYQRMVKAENSAVLWKKRAEEAEALLFKIGEYREELTGQGED